MRWVQLTMRHWAMSPREQSTTEFSVCAPNRNHLRENLASALWIAALVGVGCIVLEGYARNARLDQCHRSGALCSYAHYSSVSSPQRGGRPKESGVGIAAYLKARRLWR
jgi:hypothetical protein